MVWKKLFVNNLEKNHLLLSKDKNNAFKSTAVLKTKCEELFQMKIDIQLCVRMMQNHYVKSKSKA